MDSESASSACSAGPGPAGLIVWKSDDLKSYEKKLAPKMNEHKSANEELAKYASYRIEIVHREGDAEAETHVNNSEVFFIVSAKPPKSSAARLSAIRRSLLEKYTARRSMEAAEPNSAPAMY